MPITRRTASTQQPPAASRKRKRRPGTGKASNREKLIRKALRLIERRLDKEDINSSLSDLTRLLELTERENSEPVCAGWVDEDDG